MLKAFCYAVGLLIIFAAFNVYISNNGTKTHAYKTLQEVPPDAAMLARFEIKFIKYLQLISHKVDQEGFIQNTCDSLLWSGILCTVAPVNIEAAMNPDGQWFRTPAKDCYPNESGSTISRDTMLGALICSWDRGRLDLIQKTISYGKQHSTWSGDWKLGEGDPFRIYARPGLQATTYEISEKLGGESNWRQYLPQFWTSSTAGFNSHLQIWHLLLRGRMFGKINNKELRTLKDLAEAQPNNGFYNAAYAKFSGDVGKLNNALRAVLDESKFPENSLPTGKNFCTDILFQRDEYSDEVLKADDNGCIIFKGKQECGFKAAEFVRKIFKNPDWLPCPNNQEVEHAGIEVIETGAVILDLIR